MTDEVDVAGEEEDGDGQGGAAGRVPVVLLAVRVEPDEAEGDEGVDDGERVGDDVEDEVVSIARGRGQHDDDGDEPVLEETGERSVEGPVAGEEAGEGQDAFATELLDDSALREDHGQNISESGESDKHGKGTLGLGSHDVAEERGSENAT